RGRRRANVTRALRAHGDQQPIGAGERHALRAASDSNRGGELRERTLVVACDRVRPARAVVSYSRRAHGGPTLSVVRGAVCFCVGDIDQRDERGAAARATSVGCSDRARDATRTATQATAVVRRRGGDPFVLALAPRLLQPAVPSGGAARPGRFLVVPTRRDAVPRRTAFVRGAPLHRPRLVAGAKSRRCTGRWRRGAGSRGARALATA